MQADLPSQFKKWIDYNAVELTLKDDTPEYIKKEFEEWLKDFKKIKFI
jgi:hypothetical protein